jgi:hypothetical protein
MAITAIDQSRSGSTVTVTATSSLTGTVYFHWYSDGRYVGGGVSASRTFALPAGEQARVDVIDTNDADYDAVANAPAGFPRRVTVEFVGSPDTDISHYIIEQNNDDVARLTATDRNWLYRWTSPVLPDTQGASQNEWTVRAVNRAGNESATVDVTEEIARLGDAPDWSMSYDQPTNKITIVEVT